MKHLSQKDPRSLSRKRAAVLGAEAVAISERGGYQAPSGREIDLRASIETAAERTVSYAPGISLPSPVLDKFSTKFDVTNESTLAAGQRLASSGRTPCALNFASARNPGGGFLSGARAQEESLARASALYVCIRDDEMYGHHNATHDPMYTAWAIYSPSVPVFRGDDELLESPWLCAFVTCAAVNAKTVLERDSRRQNEIAKVMRERVRRVLAISAANGHPDLVLGAWGCGVFGNDLSVVAGLFDEALSSEFRGVFDNVVFAILDASEEQRFIAPFRGRFARRAGG